MVLENALSWRDALADEFDKPYMRALQQFLASEKAQGKQIYPDDSHWFSALEITPLEDVKVVILGQDPYHQPGQAHGLCFSVMPDIKVPPSLVNIYKELHSDLNIEPADHGFLASWAKQGVLLLNSVLTVEQGAAGAHQGQGWELFTDKIIRTVNERCENVVFLLWGGYAQKKGKSIDRERHCVLEAPHPSPLSSYRGFFGCQHFSKANHFLEKNQRPPIRWTLPMRTQLA